MASPVIPLHGKHFFDKKVCLIPPLSFLSQNLVALVSPVQPPAAVQDFENFNFEQFQSAVISEPLDGFC